ncbi:hydrogenase formation protein HypD [Marinobacterium sedimentorum]|uniref:hydrogenase formation protein HypD n=1 Tax=Marinobacterium sedimentorum TaxID=2927804 RepID=UPI0020C6CB2F|nr:hydrogenase formation protein HypD [Marinobacterium sedimentorum]MCP8690341.1 hydrogenase formation protein HypD [Marinobacterium sedimentorum]
MKYIDEFRDPAAVAQLVDQIRCRAAALPPREQPWQLMEICGGHTHTIFRFGLDQLLPDNIEFIHGPGCPVCVLPQSVIDQAIELAQRPDTLLCSYGDAMRVPGHNGSLLQARADGAHTQVVYSPRDALDMAHRHPGTQVVFLAIGFETTAPATALAIRAAALAGLTNFRVLCHLVMIEPPMRALLADPELRIDGFIGPGHVSLVTGNAPFEFIPAEYHKPVVISGFEPVDLLHSVLLLLQQLQHNQARIEIQYRRVATAGGNRGARQPVEAVFEPGPLAEWRGLGLLPHSGLQLRPAYRAFDAAALLMDSTQPATTQATAPAPEADPRCRCTAVLSGKLKPGQCPLFGRECTPNAPLGALMVSSEGACAAWYQYRHQGPSDGPH